MVSAESSSSNVKAKLVVNNNEKSSNNIENVDNDVIRGDCFNNLLKKITSGGKIMMLMKIQINMMKITLMVILRKLES